MAVDEAILTRVGRGESPPTLRFYTWSAPWVSLGSSQSHADLDPRMLAERGWKALRRSSGGTAVLHRGQLGYAVILPGDHPLWAGDLIHSYERLSFPLLSAFRALGAPVEAAPPGANACFTRGAPLLAQRACFGALGPYEIVTADSGKKLIGNSQIRRKAGATQHGVIQVSRGQEPLANVVSGSFAERAALADYLAAQATSVSVAVGRATAETEVAWAIVDGFIEALGIRPDPGDLTDAEQRDARELIESKYANEEWTFRR